MISQKRTLGAGSGPVHRGAGLPVSCRRISDRSSWAVTLTVLMTLALASQAIAQGVTVALKPSATTVATGSVITIDAEVTQSGSPFNAFDAVIGYDPAALTLIPQSPSSLQEGAYMSGACDTRYHRFRQGADSDTATDVLLCSGVSVTGPGQVYRLQFRVSNIPQVTTVRFLPGLRFYNGGVDVPLANASDATIVIVGSTPVLRPTWGSVKSRYLGRDRSPDAQKPLP